MLFLLNEMLAAKLLLKMLEEYEVEHIFGLPGETTLALYTEWTNLKGNSFPIKYVLTRDERSSVYMADAYARIKFKPGVVEGPSVGATHLVPGIVEAYKASVPLIVFTSDVPLHTASKNMLTAFNQTAVFQGITKASFTITNGEEIPHIIRRAFRIATSGKPGPVHIRIPMDVLAEEIDEKKIEGELYAQKEFTKYPSTRPTAELQKINKAASILTKAKKPVLICGQGVLHSQAWEEVLELAELLGIPVGTTISGKGSIAEHHPLAIGVIGSRGGTQFSNTVVKEADVIFFIGSNTDSANTSHWTLPAKYSNSKIIHCDISEMETGNNYKTDVILIGDAKSTLSILNEIISKKVSKKNFSEMARVVQIQKERKKYLQSLLDYKESKEIPIHPMRFINEFSKVLPDNHIITTDPGVSAIYPSAFYRLKKSGRSMIFNYSMGALGYAIPASIGAYSAKPKSCIIALTGDGSYGFTVGELETVSRIGGNINIILFNNASFGWIKGELQISHGKKYVDFPTNFQAVDYQKIAEGFGLKAYTIRKPEELSKTLQEAFTLDAPTFIDIQVLPENELVPPVPRWIEEAKKSNLKYVS